MSTSPLPTPAGLDDVGPARRPERRQGHADGAQLTMAGPKAALAGLLLQPAQATGIVARAGLKTEGDLPVLDTLASVIDTFNPRFTISTP